MVFNGFRSRRVLVAVSIVAAACAVPSTSAFAQGKDPSTHGQSPSVKLQPVIVTAEHRSQFLQNVPISINVVSAHAAAAMGVTNMSDLSVLVPGLLIGAANGGSTLTIRGIAGTSTSGDENATAIYVDGVYVANEPSTIFALSNIQSVQVLKGPQGTLFGRNSIGGAILVTTKAPSHISDADVELGYGNYATTTAQFYGTTGITKTIAANISIYTENMGEGWGDNTYLGQQAHQGHETDVRSMISWDPNGDTNATLILSADDVYDPSVQSYQVYPGYYTAAHVLSNGFWNASSDMNQFAAEITTFPECGKYCSVMTIIRSQHGARYCRPELPSAKLMLGHSRPAYLAQLSSIPDRMTIRHRCHCQMSFAAPKNLRFTSNRSGNNQAGAPWNRKQTRTLE